MRAPSFALQLCTGPCVRRANKRGVTVRREWPCELAGSSPGADRRPFPELTGSRLWRKIRELGYSGGYTAVKDLDLYAARSAKLHGCHVLIAMQPCEPDHTRSE